MTINPVNIESLLNAPLTIESLNESEQCANHFIGLAKSSCNDVNQVPARTITEMAVCIVNFNTVVTLLKSNETALLAENQQLRNQLSSLN